MFGGSANLSGIAVVVAFCGAAAVVFLEAEGATKVPGLVLGAVEISGTGFATLRPERWNTNKQVQSKAIPVTRIMGFFTCRF